MLQRTNGSVGALVRSFNSGFRIARVARLSRPGSSACAEPRAPSQRRAMCFGLTCLPKRSGNLYRVATIDGYVTAIANTLEANVFAGLPGTATGGRGSHPSLRMIQCSVSGPRSLERARRRFGNFLTSTLWRRPEGERGRPAWPGKRPPDDAGHRGAESRSLAICGPGTPAAGHCPPQATSPHPNLQAGAGSRLTAPKPEADRGGCL